LNQPVHHPAFAIADRRHVDPKIISGDSELFASSEI
jgi:hypothetical protein